MQLSLALALCSPSAAHHSSICSASPLRFTARIKLHLPVKTLPKPPFFFELKLGNLKLAQDWQHYAAVRTQRHIKLPVNTEHLMFLLKNKAHQQQGAWHSPGTELTPRVGCMWEMTRRKKLTGQVFYLVLNTSGDFPSLPESSTGSAAAFGVSPARTHLARGAPNCLKGCSSQCTK